MASMSDIEIPPFSVDLIEKSRKHLNYLRKVHASGISLRAPSENAIRRYEKLWLPLISSVGNEKMATGGLWAANLVPPTDIAWLWHCHRLSPQRSLTLGRGWVGG